MDYLQYGINKKGDDKQKKVLNLIINGLPSIHILKYHPYVFEYKF